MVSPRERLAGWIQRSELTQRSAAKLLGLHYTYLNQILIGRRSPGLNNAVTIEHVTGIPAVSWATTRVGKAEAATSSNGRKRSVGRA